MKTRLSILCLAAAPAACVLAAAAPLAAAHVGPLSREERVLVRTYLADPVDDAPTYRAIRDNLRAPHPDLRYYAVRAGLEVPAFRADALDVGIADADPAIRGLALARLEHGWRPRLLAAVLDIAERGGEEGRTAYLVLKRQAPDAVGRHFLRLYRAALPETQAELLDLAEGGKAPVAPSDFASLLADSGVDAGVRIFRALFRLGRVAEFSAAWSRWPAARQSRFLVRVGADPAFLADPAAHAFLPLVRDAATRAAWRARLLSSKNGALRAAIARAMEGFAVPEDADGAAREVLSYGLADAAERWARAALDLAAWRKARRELGALPAPDRGAARELAELLRADSKYTMGAVERLRALLARKAALERELAELKRRLAAYCARPEAAGFRRIYAGPLSEVGLR